MKFQIAMFLKRPLYFKYRKELMINNYKSYEEKQKLQFLQFKDIVKYHYNNNIWYKKKLDELGINPYEIRNIEDIRILPILNKNDYYEMNEFLLQPSKRTVKCMTGGSTGVPLRFYMSEKDYLYGVILLYRGWSYAGYKPGDKVAILAGYSLLGNDSNIIKKCKKKVFDWALNFRHYSSMDMTEENLEKYINNMNEWKPKFLRGYASSIYILATYIKTNSVNLKFKVNGIFTTSEKLYEPQRKVIEEVFNCRVYDHYGLNDGGLSAFECNEHIGMHVDAERSMLEIVDENENSKFCGEGNIIATALYNYDYPFIRYNTNDSGTVVIDNCKCGIQGQIIKRITGRQTDFLNINGVRIGGPVLTTIWADIDVLQYQFDQTGVDKLSISIVKGNTYSNIDEERLRNRIYSHFGKIELNIQYTKHILPRDGNKYKFIIKSFEESNNGEL